MQLMIKDIRQWFHFAGKEGEISTPCKFSSPVNMVEPLFTIFNLKSPLFFHGSSFPHLTSREVFFFSLSKYPDQIWSTPFCVINWNAMQWFAHLTSKLPRSGCTTTKIWLDWFHYLPAIHPHKKENSWEYNKISYQTITDAIFRARVNYLREKFVYSNNSLRFLKGD